MTTSNEASLAQDCQEQQDQEIKEVQDEEKNLDVIKPIKRVKVRKAILKDNKKILSAYMKKNLGIPYLTQIIETKSSTTKLP